MTAALGLPAGFFDSNFDNPILILRPIHYTAEQSDINDGVFGAGIPWSQAFKAHLSQIFMVMQFHPGKGRAAMGPRSR